MPETNSKITSRIAVLANGLYVVRYVSGPQGGPFDCVTLNPSPIGRGSVDFFPAEGVTRNTLTKVGDCIVVRVKGEQAGLLLTEFASTVKSSPIELRIDRIATAGRDAQDSQTQIRQTAPPPRVVLKGHVQRLGDVIAENGWLGAPQSINRIEGFSVDLADFSPGLVLAYSCRSGKGAEPDVGTNGHFVGTRRQAKPITSVAFALSGERAADFELVGQVVFAASPPLAIVSAAKELSGPTGAEPLVALNLEIRPTTTQASPPASPWSDMSRTQVFKE
ncbi:hypothetical protein MXC99_01545 [Thauera aromatica]|uniref:hypothetical protein n=1 Tax=Thauera aromatica TaxID=59405 RepID=UPI001FFD66BE|nr:hypothetical protein [Thauera aromatica]MCK2086877.1 hypothetical protein [Thauera aromatica]